MCQDDLSVAQHEGMTDGRFREAEHLVYKGCELLLGFLLGFWTERVKATGRGEEPPRSVWPGKPGADSIFTATHLHRHEKSFLNTLIKP